MESLAGKFNVTSLPAGNTGSAATLGGWELMVSRYSKHPKQAVELVRFLAGEREQRRRAIDGANAPTIASLYKDPDVLTAVPFLVGVERLLESAVLRPSAIAGSRYDHISRIYYSAVHDILNGSDAHSRLDRAAVQMQEVMAQ